MKFSEPKSVSELANMVGGEVVGDPKAAVEGINEINVVEKGDLVFVDHPKYYQKALNSAATFILINKNVEAPAGKTLIVCDDPFAAFNRIMAHFSKRSFASKAISDSARIGKNTRIMPNCFIGDNVVIGDNCTIHPNVTIYDNCRIGNSVVLHSGVVIGADAFYYKKRATGYDRLLSGGTVVIEDHVELGALTSVDRGVSGATVIGQGTKIDNQVQIGHDTKVGKNCLFASQVGVSGACVIEDDVILWGQVGVPSKIRIGKGAVLLGQSAPIGDVEGGKTYLGSPIEEARKKLRELSLIRKLPEIVEKLNK